LNHISLAVDGDDGLRRSHSDEYAVMTIDRMLPRLDGLIVLRRLREDGIVGPALTLSALGGTDDRVQGLRVGYDDYVIKPFAFAKLQARLDALARRSEEVVKETVLRVGDLCRARRAVPAAKSSCCRADSIFSNIWSAMTAVLSSSSQPPPDIGDPQPDNFGLLLAAAPAVRGRRPVAHQPSQRPNPETVRQDSRLGVAIRRAGEQP
jgi:CheY-like chemotaxis protein